MDKFGCKKCIEKPSNLEGHHYNYEKNSVLLFNKWKKIAIQGLGTNIQPEHPQTVVESHQFSCNGCGNCPKSQ